MRRRLLEDTGFVPVAGADHTMIAVRNHLYEDVRVLLEQTNEAPRLLRRLQVSILGTRTMVIGSAHFSNKEAKKTMATEWAKELCEEAVVLRCAAIGQPALTCPRQEEVVGLIVWASPLLEAHLAAKSFSYYNQELHWNIGDTDSHYLVAAYFRDPQLPKGAQARNPFTEAERRRRQQAVRNEWARAQPAPASGSGALGSAGPRPTTEGPRPPGPRPAEARQA